MPLINIPYQPLGMNIVRPTDCFACDEREYCMPVIPGDPIYQQFRQTPCTASIVCDGDFTSIIAGAEVIPDTDFTELEAEIIVNGGFTGNANNWVLGTGWAYNSNNIRKTAGVASSARQVLPSPTISDAVYEVTYTITNRTAGTLTPQLITGLTIYSGAVASSNATFTTYIKAFLPCDTFLLTASSAFDGDVDTVSVRRIAPTWSFGGTSLVGWDIEDTTGFAITIDAGVYGDCTGCGLIQSGIVQPLTDYTVVVSVEDGTGTFVVNVGGTDSVYYALTGGPQTVNVTITSGAGTDFYIAPGENSRMKVSEITLLEVSGLCWDFDTALWVATGDSICKIPGTADNLINTAVLTQNVLYQIKVTVEGRTAGFIQLSVAGVLGDVIDSNGIFTQYFTPASTTALTIYANSLFDGCITLVEIFPLKNDFVFNLIDSDGTVVAIISDNNGNAYGRVIYSEDYVTLNFTIDEMLDVNAHDIEYGCYRIEAFDVCEIQYEEVIVDGEFSNPYGIYWKSVGGGGTVVSTIVAGQLTMTRVSTVGTDGSADGNYYDITNWQSNPKILTGAHNYRVEFDIISNTDPVNIRFGVAFGDGSTASAYTVGSHSIVVNNVNPSPGAQQRIGVFSSFPSVNGVIVADEVHVFRIEPYDVTYTSQCIDYRESMECTKVIQGYCDSDNMGFKFYDDVLLQYIYKLSQRIYIRAINPSGKDETDDYLFSNGTRQRQFSQTSKVFTLLTDHLPEWSLDTLREQRNTDHFSIGEPVDDDFREWYCWPSDFSPEWPKNGESKLAPVRFELSEKEEETKFNRRI